MWQAEQVSPTPFMSALLCGLRHGAPLASAIGPLGAKPIGSASGLPGITVSGMKPKRPR